MEHANSNLEPASGRSDAAAPGPRSGPCEGAEGPTFSVRVPPPAVQRGSSPLEEPRFGRRLRRARLARRWSQTQLAQRMRDVAVGHGGTARLASLKIMLSKWENNHKVPNQYNRHLVAQALGLEVSDLGLWADPDFRF